MSNEVPSGDIERRFARASNTLSDLIACFPHEHTGDLLDLMAGALVSLIRARQLGYKDRTEKPLSAKYYTKLAQLLKRISTGTFPADGPWAAGHQFNSALFRLGAAREITRRLLTALDKRKETKGPNLQTVEMDDVYEEYRSLKHDLRSIRMGRRVTLQQAVDSFDELVHVLDLRRKELCDPQTTFPAWSRNR